MSVQPQFYDHEVVQKSPDDYVEISVSPKDVLQAWSLSMFAHEILDKTGTVKAESAMAEDTLKKYLEAVECLKRGEDVAKPIIGIGLTDGIEIGIGREVIAACAIMNVHPVICHIRRAQESDIRKML